MTTGSFVWIVIFAVAAFSFFLIAGVVAVRGFNDLKELLRISRRKMGGTT